MALVGWLWADLLLGLFALFLAANSAGTPIRAAEGIDPTPVELRIAVDGAALLAGGPAADREQARVAGEAERMLAQAAGSRRVAIVLAFARHASPGEGDRIATLATERLREGRFSGSVVKTYHELATGDAGTLLSLEVYLFH
ncbi:MAG TPA: hypothetical protein VFM93_04380 [Candidatus Limnocylindria bacterium]|nr:hypothetical protein [Candidatus Limnocylindria bacterium]